MTEESKSEKPSATNTQWGNVQEDNFGYASEEERLAKRGLEDWELLEKIPESQANVPPWFFAVIGVVLLVAIGLSFPFWGDRVGYERTWFDWGFVVAIVYILVFGSFVYVMVRMYSKHSVDRPDSDKKEEPSINDKQAESAETKGDAHQ